MSLPKPPVQHKRTTSFSFINEEEATKVFKDVLREAGVILGGAALGQGLKLAANYQLMKKREEMGMNFDKNIAPLLPVEESFYVVDVGVVLSQVYQWRKAFPRVEPFYAVKCNPDPMIIKTLAIFGCNFDCASRGEIRLVQEATKDLPIRKPEIIYANPCKARSHMIEAINRGVTMVTFDNESEVEKCHQIVTQMQKHYNNKDKAYIELIMRIVTDDRGSQCRLSSKFGAHRQKWRSLLATAKKFGIPVVGVSFHVGSGCRDSSRYELALEDAREIFDMAEKDYGMKMSILDIGGGFPGKNPLNEMRNC